MDQSKQISISSKPSNQPMKDRYKEKKKNRPIKYVFQITNTWIEKEKNKV